MKIILSRKGFDASYGKVASPILPDGTMQSLPIPYSHSPVTYGDLVVGTVSLGTIAEDLTGGRISRSSFAHLDPDIRRTTYRREAGWKPLFGQVGAAQSHLERNHVAPGDIFLFFGWFRQVEYTSGKYRFVKSAPDLHVIYGWLQIGRILKPGKDQAQILEWAMYHPHMQPNFGSNNTVYIAADQLQIGDKQLPIPGGGAFENYEPSLNLTAPGQNRSVWRLPPWFVPRVGQFPLTYHNKPSRWAAASDHALVQSTARGQEFILDTSYYPEAVDWVSGLIARAT